MEIIQVVKRVVASTLAGEAQAFSTASGITEWCLLLLAECMDGPFRLELAHEVLPKKTASRYDPLPISV